MKRIYNENDLAYICGVVSDAIRYKKDERIRVSAITTLVQTYPMHVLKGVFDALHDAGESSPGEDIPESVIDGFRAKSVANMNAYTEKDGFKNDVRAVSKKKTH